MYSVAAIPTRYANVDEQLELWKPVARNEQYDVSSQGRVRRRFRWKKSEDGYILTPARTKDGYLRVGLCHRGKSTAVMVHRLVTEAFIGPIKNGLEVNHLNGVKADNRAQTLGYVTHLQNSKHAKEFGLLPEPRTGEAIAISRLTEDMVHLIRRENARGVTGAAIADHFGLPRATVHQMLSGRTWSWLKTDLSSAREPVTGLQTGQRRKRGEDNHTSKLTENDVVEIRRLRHAGVELAELSRRFGISPISIYRAARGKTWRHVPGACAPQGKGGGGRRNLPADQPTGLAALIVDNHGGL